MDNLNTNLLWEFFKHVRAWLANLNRAGTQRKEQSVHALRGVIKASRETAVYVRWMRDRSERKHEMEARLAVLWTELGFALEDLGIGKLAKRCQIAGKHWSDPDHYDAAFLKKADISLERMEHLAREIMRGIRE